LRALRSQEAAPRVPNHHVPRPSVEGGEADGFHVMIFNAGRPDEAVYTHALDQENPAILAFECAEDADRFSQELLGRGFEFAMPLHWSAARLSTFCRTAGFEVSTVPRGTLPTLPHTIETSERGDAERKHPEDGTARRDPYTSYRLWLEELIHYPDTCGDEDCIIR
jgi:hypothetical protein